MNAKYRQPLRSKPWAASAGLTILLTAFSTQEIFSQPSLQITGAATVASRVLLNWTSITNALHYEIQTTTNLAAPDWRTILATYRTNVVIPPSAAICFFRIVGPKPYTKSVVISTTNPATGDFITLTMQPQTNADLVFENLADTNASVSVRSIYSGADLTLLDLRFDNGGGFSFVTTNGEPTGSGGFVSLSSGPGAGQITYSGLLSNDTSTVLFSTVTTPSAARPGWVSAQGDGESGWLDGPLNWIYAPFSSLWCSPGWALKDLQCKAAAFPRTLECVGSFPFPRGYVPIGFIVNKTQPKIVVTYNEFNLPTGFKIEGVCGAQCETCCRHPNPFANIYVDCVVSP